MKKLIFTLLLLVPITSFGQATLTLDSDTNSIYVGAFEHPKNTLRAKYSDSGLAIIGTDNTTFAADRKYDTYINGGTDSTFATFDALKAWVRENFFVDASAGSYSGGGDTATLTSVTTGTGNNITPNAIQITGEDNLNDTLGGITLAYNPAASDISFFTPGTYSGGVAFNTLNGQLQFNTTNNVGSVVYIPLVLHPDATGSEAIAGHFNGRLQVSDAIDGSDVPILSQVGNIVNTAVLGRSFSDTTMTGTAFTPSTTPQTILTIPIPTGKVFSIELRVVATTEGDPNEGAAYHNVVLSKNEAGTVSVLGSMTTLHTPIITTNLALEGLIVSATPSGTNLLIQVAMTTDNYSISWKAYASIISL